MKKSDHIRSQIDLLSVANGFMASRVLFALTRLGVFEFLGQKEKSIEDLSHQVGGRPETLSRLLNAGVAYELLESGDGVVFRIGRRWVSSLDPSAGDTYLGDWIHFLDQLDRTLAELDQAVLHGGGTRGIYEGRTKLELRRSTLAMHNYASFRGRELAGFLDLTKCRSLLDLGCGPGTYAFQLGLKNPDLRLFLLDTPEILEIAREIQSRYELTNEVNYLEIDVTKEDIPGSYDAVLVSNALHVIGEDASRRLLGQLHALLNPGGSVIIQAQFLDEDRKGGRWPTIIDLAMLCGTQEGRNHTEEETRRWLLDAGFTNIELNRMGVFNTNSYLRGYKRDA